MLIPKHSNLTNAYKKNHIACREGQKSEGTPVWVMQ